MNEASADRQKFLRDLEARENKFNENLKSAFKEDSGSKHTEHLTELEILINEIKEKERQSEALAQAKSVDLVEFKLHAKFDSAQTRDYV